MESVVCNWKNAEQLCHEFWLIVILHATNTEPMSCCLIVCTFPRLLYADGGKLLGGLWTSFLLLNQSHNLDVLFPGVADGGV